jgi:hypothetical protein
MNKDGGFARRLTLQRSRTWRIAIWNADRIV